MDPAEIFANIKKTHQPPPALRENCPACNQELREVMDKDGFLIDRRCDRCAISLSIFDLEIKEKKKINLEKWL